MDYINIKVKDKQYIQRSKHSKIIEIKNDNIINTYENNFVLPKPIQYEFNKAKELRDNPEKYFEYIIKPDNTIKLIKFHEEKLTNIKNIIIPEEIKGYDVNEVGDKLFALKTGIKRIYFNNNTLQLGEGVCLNCTELEEVILSKKTKIISKEAFCNCNNLKSINLSNIELIIEYGFNQCINLCDVELDNCKIIDDNGFSGSGIKEVNAPNLRHIGNSAFSDNYRLKNIKYNEDVVFGKSVFKKCIMLDNIKLPDNMFAIKESCFAYCHNLKNINIPNELKVISEYAFYKSGLEEILLPPSLEEIQKGAFFCDNLNEIKVSKNTIIDENAFSFESKLKIKTYDETFISNEIEKER